MVHKNVRLRGPIRWSFVREGTLLLEDAIRSEIEGKPVGSACSPGRDWDGYSRPETTQLYAGVLWLSRKGRGPEAMPSADLNGDNQTIANVGRMDKSQSHNFGFAVCVGQLLCRSMIQGLRRQKARRL
jgi:hypothetical protein